MRNYYESFWKDLSSDEKPWAYESRKRLLAKHLKKGDRVLDLGCGAGWFVGDMLRAGSQAIGVDIAQTALNKARENVPGGDFRLISQDGSIPLEHNLVDLVWSSEVIEHIADTATFLEEARRVLRPGGRLVLTTPFHGHIKNLLIALNRFESHFDPLGQHLRFYTKRSLRSVLKNAHFERIDIRAVGGMPTLRHTLVAVAS